MRHLTLQSCLFLKKTLKYIYQQRYASNGYCEVLNVKVNIWFDIHSKYIEDFCIIVSVAVGMFSERLTDTCCQYFPFGFLPFQNWCENVFWRVFFPELACLFFFFFLDLCHMPATCYSWILFLKQKVVHCVLRFWLFCVMLRSYMLILLGFY